jgi:hypothetical protein
VLLAESLEGRGNRHTRAIIIGVGSVTAAVAAVSTQFAFPPSTSWRSLLYFLLGVMVTIAIAYMSDVVQDTIHRVQLEIKDFLMEMVNSRHERTAAMIDLCRNAAHEFCAVTYLPVVGIQDDPETAPGEYLRALEEILLKEASVTLVSVSCREAREYCEARDEFDDSSRDALLWVEERLAGLVRRFPEKFQVITIPGEAITVNVCHNDSTALMYHVGLDGDSGAGFKSTDARIVAVAKGGVERYAKYNEPLPPPAEA